MAVMFLHPLILLCIQLSQVTTSTGFRDFFQSCLWGVQAECSRWSFFTSTGFSHSLLSFQAFLSSPEAVAVPSYFYPEDSKSSESASFADLTRRFEFHTKIIITFLLQATKDHFACCTHVFCCFIATLNLRFSNKAGTFPHGLTWNVHKCGSLNLFSDYITASRLSRQLNGFLRFLCSSAFRLFHHSGELFYIFFSYHALTWYLSPGENCMNHPLPLVRVLSRMGQTRDAVLITLQQGWQLLCLRHSIRGCHYILRRKLFLMKPRN